MIPYGPEEAVLAGSVMAQREAVGRPMSVIVAQIAGTCLARGAALATRIVHDFQGVGLDVLDPWAA